MCTYKGCKRPKHPNTNDCIFHLVKSAKPLWEVFRKSIHKQIQNEKNCDFIGYNFPYGFHNFEEGTVLSNADFSGTSFQSNIFFKKMTFVGVTIFHDIEGSKLQLYDCVVKGKMEFRETPQLILEKVNFEGAKAELSINSKELDLVASPNNISILKCNFLKKSTLSISNIRTNTLIISGLTFQNSKCQFYMAENDHIFKFRNNTFEDSDFEMNESKFSGDVFLFEQTNNFNPTSSIKFEACKITAQNTDFSDVNFSCKTDFVKCKFKEYSDFRNTSGLENCLFRQSNVDDINIEGVHWENSGKIRDESVLEIVNAENEDYDQLSELEQKSELIKAYKHAEDTYRKLKHNYDSIRDYSRSSIFYIREKECARRSKMGFEKFGLGFLLITCKYGESITRVLLSSLGIICFWAILFLFSGFENGKTVINYDLIGKVSFPEWSDIGLAVGLSAKSFFIALKQFEELKPSGLMSSILGGLESLIGVFFVGLFVFVFRRYLRK